MITIYVYSQKCFRYFVGKFEKAQTDVICPIVCTRLLVVRISKFQ